MIKIPHYESSYFLFSNFSPHQILYKDVLYSTLEHAFQAQKFLNEDARDKVKNAKSPLEALQLGRSLPGKRNDWSSIKLDCMYQLLKAKVEQHEEVKSKLFASGNEEVVEQNPNDDFWGSGPDGNGQNQMGKILMKIRDELKT